MSQEYITELLRKHKLVEDVVHNQNMPRRQLVEVMVHRKHLAEIQTLLAKLPAGELGSLFEALAADDVEEKIDFLESNPVTKELTAVRNKRYVILDAADMDPGIRNVSAIEKLAAGLRDIGVVD